MNGRHEHECHHLGHYLEHRKEVLRDAGVCVIVLGVGLAVSCD